MHSCIQQVFTEGGYGPTLAIQHGAKQMGRLLCSGLVTVGYLVTHKMCPFFFPGLGSSASLGGPDSDAGGGVRGGGGVFT